MAQRFTHWLWGWVKSIAVALVCWFILSALVVQAFHIPSSSMENTLLVGDVLWVNKLLYGAEIPLIHKRLPAIREPRRGEILVFDSVEQEGLEVVKRLIGTPGDTIAMENGVLIRNGQRLEEPWVEPANRLAETDPLGRNQMRQWQVKYLVSGDTSKYTPEPNNWGPIVVPRDSFFMMGDNRRESYDGRFWGFLPRRNVRGTPLIVYYSWDANTYKPLPLVTNVRWRRLFTIPR